MSKRTQAIIALVVANTIWGAASPIFKITLENVPLFTLAFLRFFGASLIILPLVYRDLKIEKKDWFKLLLLSLFGISIHITFYFLGLEKTQSISAPMIASSGPIFLYIFSIFLLHEKSHPKVILGILVSLIGVLLIIGQPLIEEEFAHHFFGNLLIIVSTLAAVAHTIISKEIITRYNPIKITFWAFLIGSATFFPMFVWDLFSKNPFSTINASGISGILYGMLLSSAVAYTLFEFGVKYLKAQDVGVFTYINPIAALLVAVPLLQETVTPIFIIASILVFFGIFIAEGRLHFHPQHRIRH